MTRITDEELGHALRVFVMAYVALRSLEGQACRAKRIMSLMHSSSMEGEPPAEADAILERARTLWPDIVSARARVAALVDTIRQAGFQLEEHSSARRLEININTEAVLFYIATNEDKPAPREAL